MRYGLVRSVTYFLFYFEAEVCNKYVLLLKNPAVSFDYNIV